MKTDTVDQQPDILDTSEQTTFNDFLNQIKEQQKNIDMRLFSKYLPYERSDKMAQVLYNLKSKADNNNVVSLIDVSLFRFAERVKRMPTDTN